MDLQLFISRFILKQGSSINISFCLNWVIILQIQSGNFQVCLQFIIYIVLSVEKQKSKCSELLHNYPCS